MAPHRPATDRHHARSKLHSNRQIMDRLETFVCKLKKQTRLADTLDKRKVSNPHLNTTAHQSYRVTNDNVYAG